MSEATVASALAGPPRRQRRWPRLVGVLAIVVAATVATTLLVLAAVRDEGYGPLGYGDSAGTEGPGLTGNVDGVRRLLPDAGPAYSKSLLDNEGTHAVRVLGVDVNSTIRAAQWAPMGPPSETILKPSRWRAFPAVVPAEGTIQIRLRIGRSDWCRNVEPGDGVSITFSGGYDVRWQSRRSEHVTSVVGNRDGPGALQLC